MTAAEDQLLALWTASAAIWGRRTRHLWDNHQGVDDDDVVSANTALSDAGLIESYADRKKRLSKLKASALSQPQPVMRLPRGRGRNGGIGRNNKETGCKPGSQRAQSRASRAAAIAAGRNVYLGAVCKYGHRPGNRWVKQNDCCTCTRLRHQRDRLMFPRGTWHSVETVDGSIGNKL
jgi:hypothetical protein